MPTVAPGPAGRPHRRRARPITLVLVSVALVSAALVAGVLLASPGAAPDGMPGVVADGGRDVGPALQRALDTAAPGTVFELSPGEYLHGGVLTVRTPGVTLRGAGAVLTATDPRESALAIEADDVTVEGLTLRGATPTGRIPGRTRSLVWIHGAAGTVLRDLTIEGSAAAGVVVDGASGFRIERAVVRDTGADGIHVIGGSHDGVVDRPAVTRSGDDGVSVVSYGRDTRAVSDVRIVAPTVTGQRRGRGVSVVGGSGIRISDVDIDGSAAAAIYIAVEGAPWNTRPVTDVAVTGGTVGSANTDARADHGAVTVFLGTPDAQVSGVTVSDLTITGTRATARADVQVKSRYGVLPQDLRFSGLHIANGTARAFGGNVPSAAYAVD